jgi:7,8-dihydropterin-6-yl-methyl-4-(beta-D-ribofuranosyl)aminobenzene 5'-phosphate synthase
MGQSDLFAANAASLSVDLASIETAVLSHGHYDHGGGISRFLLANKAAPVYMSALAFGEHYNANNKYIGLDTALLGEKRIIFTDTDYCLGDGISILQGKTHTPTESIDPFGLTIKRNSALQDEDFLHEQYMLIEEKGMKILFSGCSHRGLFNILDWFSPDIFIGGFHFTKIDADTEDGRARLENYAKRLLALPCTYYTCHCTGVGQYELLHEIMKDRINYISAGAELQI